MKRWFRSLKTECLDRMVFFGRKSLENACVNTSSITTPNGIIRDAAMSWLSRTVMLVLLLAGSNAESDSVASSSITTVALPDEPCHESDLNLPR